MSERNGVINLHLAVEVGGLMLRPGLGDNFEQMTDAKTMTMLYKVNDGYVTEQHYGIISCLVILSGSSTNKSN